MIASTISTKSMYCTQCGFTMTEIAIVLSIIGLIIGAIWGAASAAFENMRINKAKTEITKLIYQYSMLVPPGKLNGSAGYITCLGVTGGAFDRELVQSVPCTDLDQSTAPTTPWRTLPNPLSLASVELVSDADINTIEIQFSLIPKDACVALAQFMKSNANVTAVVMSNASPFSSNFINGHNNYVNTSIQTISQDCGANNNSSTVAFLVALYQ